MTDEPRVIVPAAEDFAYIRQREREIRDEGREEQPPAPQPDCGCYDGA